MADVDDDTARTADDVLVEQLRQQGILGPFSVSDWSGLTDTGRVRHQNEDRWLGDPEFGFVVADGMGGHEGGSLAADTTCRVAFEHLSDLTEATARDVVQAANSAVLRAGAKSGLDRLGSTLVVLANRRTHVVIVNVGDSRVYRWRDGEVELLTIDHSVRNDLAAAGVGLEAAADANVRLDALTSFIGQRSEFTPTYRAASFSIMSGDRFLLCSDGIHGQLTNVEMADALGTGTCRDVARQLIDGASGAGGTDNATALVVEFSAMYSADSFADRSTP